MAEQIFKELKTKIALKYLDFATWSAESFKSEKPLKGEVWFCEIPNGNAEATTAPTVLFKVGDGTNTFGSLKWGSALAADVYDWAKQSGVKLEGEGNAVTNAVVKTAADGKKYLTFEKSTIFATKAELDAAIEAFGGDLSAITDNDHQYSFAITDGKLEVKAVNYVNGKAGETTTVATLDFVTPAELTTVLEGYKTKQTAYSNSGSTVKTITKVEQNANGEVAVTYEDIAFPTRVADATHADAAEKVDEALTIKVGGVDVVFDGSAEKTADVDSAIATAVEEAKKYADDHDADTKYGLVYDKDHFQLILVEGHDKQAIDVSDWEQDTRVTDFKVDSGRLVLSQNSGEADLSVDLEDIRIRYSGSDSKTITINVDERNEIEGNLNANSVSKGHLDTDVKASLALADSALQADDISHLATTEALNGVNAKFDNYYTKTEADAEFATPAEVISEVNKALADVSNADSITNITTLVEYVNENAGDLSTLITEVYGAAEMTGNSRIDTAVADAAQAKADATAAVGTANSAATVADEAKTLAEGAVTTANEAKTAATTAQNSAAASAAAAKASEDNAKASEQAAGTAKADAEAAKIAAVNAQGAAEAAQGKAETAQTKAEEAQAAAEDARNKAQAAQSTAVTAADDAGKALASANNAKVAAEAAQGKAEAAQAAAEQAKADAVASNTSATAIANEAKQLATSANTTAGEAKAAAEDAVDRVEALENAHHISEITTTANGGLKVTNKNHIDIDTDIVFILNANF